MSSLTRLRPALLAVRAVRSPQFQQTRHGSLVYRGVPPPTRKAYLWGEAIMGLTWFWILWRYYHDPELIWGHFPYPDTSKWTNEELGIPPDDED
ncbi:NADH dehydrogenase [ubiquinone] 1 beta subcomplex subunit 2, mitochondrial-like [Ptychodera flava]|uniref:NADH dehydrogenase [ubiquinone] 1 beta subcomplex subunit 2, mitochondrial-like n=1 Tax=Ptychodera flava TaxID=63121 RepID=UPI00396A70BE